MNPTRQAVLRLGCQILARWLPTLLIGGLICTAAFWLWSDVLSCFQLKLDDFVYLARSRSTTALWAHLFTPHNSHVVPLFLCETHLLTRVAGMLAALPGMLAWASYATLALAMAAGGHLVAWETGRAEWGLAAMAAVGCSSVVGPAVLWYSASQALAAGTVILLMLVMLQAWRGSAHYRWLAASALAAVAAPLFWSAGFTAGLVGMAYLWADGRRRCRIASLVPMTASFLTASLVWGLSSHDRGIVPRLPDRPLADRFNLPAAAAHTAQAIVEKLVLNNLGLEASTSAPQAIVLCAVFASVWAASRGWRGLARDVRGFRINPLEAAGAVMVVANFGLIFAVRGTETTFGNLRALGWYDAIPQLGAVVFAAGWWAGNGSSSPARSIDPPTARSLGVVLLFIVLFLSLQIPRARRIVFAYDGLSTSILDEDGQNETRFRSPRDLADQAVHQRQALARLDVIEWSARGRSVDPRMIGAAPSVPGMPENVPDLSAFDLLENFKNKNPTRDSGR